MQLGNIGSQRNIENIYKRYDGRNRKNMNDKKVSDERNQTDKNKDRLTDDIEFLKVGILCSKIERYNNEKKSDEINQVNIIYDKEYDERDKIGEKQRINIEYRYLIFESDKIDF